MITTPICDFVAHYKEKDLLRLHMPGHKGELLLGAEPYDITEIEGADSLYEADGIIRESEENASVLFGCKTVYSTEGSSQCIRAMLYLAMLDAVEKGRKPLIAAGRNAHKTFISGVALLNLEVTWLFSKETFSYLSCNISPKELEQVFLAAEEKPTAVYITSPDYLGNVADIAGIAAVCHRFGALLLVDNAHGAYLKFLPESQHPIDLGADICCDSAHKTLLALTGGAYLHIADRAPLFFSEQVKNALVLFGSTSPSYLILQSLDRTNRYLFEGYCDVLGTFITKAEQLKERLIAHGYTLLGDEPLKCTIYAKPYGYSGSELADRLYQKGIVCEFSDPDFTVMMLTPQVGEAGLSRLGKALLEIPKQEPLTEKPPVLSHPKRVMSIKEAIFSPNEEIPVSQSEGRVLASASVGCPPAVPIVVCGEVIQSEAMDAFSYYHVASCFVVKKK